MMNLRFVKTTIGVLPNDVGPAPMNTFLAVGDVDGDGRDDVVLSGRDGTMAWFGQPGDAANEAWPMHVVDPAIAWLECGGVIADLTGDGRGDIICGGDWRSDELAWWENPGPAGGTWVRGVIARTGANQFHDQILGPRDGRWRAVAGVWRNQGDGSLYRVPIPSDPRGSPWPGIERIATGLRVAGLPEEGLAIADIDGDGRDEIIAGTHWYKHGPAGWDRHRFVDEALEYVTTVIAVGDVDADGHLEIVLAEGDCCIYGRPEGEAGRGVSPAPLSADMHARPWRRDCAGRGIARSAFGGAGGSGTGPARSGDR